MRWPLRRHRRRLALLRDARSAAGQLHSRLDGLLRRRLAGRHLDRPWLDRPELHPGQRVERHCQLLCGPTAAAAALAAPNPTLAAAAAACAATAASRAEASSATLTTRGISEPTWSTIPGDRDRRHVQQRGVLGADVRWPHRSDQRWCSLRGDARSAAGHLHSRFDGLLRRRLAGRHLDSPWLDRPELRPGQRVERHCQLLCGPACLLRLLELHRLHALLSRFWVFRLPSCS